MIFNNCNVGIIAGAILTSTAKEQQRADRKNRRVLFMAAVKKNKNYELHPNLEWRHLYFASLTESNIDKSHILR